MALIYAVLARLLWNKDKMRLLAEAHLSLAVVFGTWHRTSRFRGYPTFAFWTPRRCGDLLDGLPAKPCARSRVCALLQAGAAAYFWWSSTTPSISNRTRVAQRSRHRRFADRRLGFVDRVVHAALSRNDQRNRRSTRNRGPLPGVACGSCTRWPSASAANGKARSRGRWWRCC